MLTTTTISPQRTCSAGLRLPIGDGATVAKGDRLVGALGPGSAKGHVKSASAVTDLPTDFEDLDAAGINDDTKKLAAYNAARTQINSVSETVGDLVDAAKGKGSVVDFDTTDALVCIPRVTHFESKENGFGDSECEHVTKGETECLY